MWWMWVVREVKEGNGCEHALFPLPLCQALGNELH